MCNGPTPPFGNGLGTSSCAFTITQNSTVTGTFDASNPTSTLVINTIAGAPTGVVRADNGMCPPTCALNYVTGSLVDLNEMGGGGCPNCVGTGFSGDCVSSGPFCSFSITRNSTVTASFAPGPGGDGHRAALAMRLHCDPTARRGRTVNAAVEVRNQSGRQLTLTRAALGLHVGNVSFVGPLVVNLPALPLALASDADASLTVPVAIPSSARPGTFISVGVSLFGREGASSARRRLGGERCSIEVLP